jgi:hypothetical protein
VDLLPGARWNREVPEFRFSGLPRPALVDALKPGETLRGGRQGDKVSELRSRKSRGPSGVPSPGVPFPAPEKAAPLSLPGGPESSLLTPQGGESEIIVDLGAPGDSGGGRAGPPGQGPLTVEQALGRELGETLNYDIVQEARILLRGGGEGTIRLSLRPETLGNIKIRLEMAENKIKGHIVVESGEALRAFRQELASLEQAFRDSGFSDASMSLAQGDESGGGGEGRREGENSRFDPARAASLYDEGSLEGFLSDSGEAVFYAPPGTKAVNLLV